MSREEEIFATAALAPAAERDAVVASACAGDERLRARVQALLRASDEADDFFGGTVVTRPISVPEEKSGDRIGRYRLLQKIGEGGCGVVYMAGQEVPVRRRVALKVIKLGMDTKEVIARFEAERQALALMDHPNIARVLDAGATETGRPFFVMELVRGIPITRYCDEENLPTAERLRLFVQVCQAIQHAHEKGIIHRDIKPTNILVTMHDDVAVPKVIDFGIAKATQGRLTDKTVFTAFEQFIGTPAYMSPEQAQMNDLEVDTRSDVYSLGVLLYELLAGRPPFDPKTLAQSGIDEIRRIIREVEPPRPSTRFSTLDASDRATIARQRRIAPAQLSVLVRGDLDWIAMKAMEKNRTRRYATAGAVAADIRKHLGHEPVLARPPSTLYRLGKFTARHKSAIVGGVAVVVSLAAGLTLSRVIFREQGRHESASLPASADVAQPPATTTVAGAAPAESALVVRQVPMAKFPGTWGAAAVSPDGRHFLYGGDGNQMMLFNTETQTLQKIANANRGQCFSSDSKQVALLVGRLEEGAELRVFNLDGTPVRTVAKFTRETFDYVRLHRWSPDGRQFAVTTRMDGIKNISVIDATGGAHRVVRTLGRREPRRIDFSPDGRWLVYDAAVDETGSNSDLFVVDLATGHESPLVQHKSDDHLLGWSPRGDVVLFTSNRRGNFDAWRVPVVEGKTAGEPVLIKRDLGEPEPIGFTNSGAFYYAHREWVQDVYSLPLDPVTGRAAGKAFKAVDRFEGTNSAATWSPDGRKLAYSTRQPPFFIRLLDPATQEDHILAEGLYGPKWSPDGKSLLCFSQWDGEEKKLYVVDVATGSRRVIEDGKPAGSLFRAYQWAPEEGGAIYYEYGINEKPWTTTIVRRDLATGAEREIYRRDNGGFFAVSPDGRMLVHRAGSKLLVMPIAGGETRVVYEVPKGHYIPGWDLFTWSADGRAVYVGVWRIDRQVEHMPDSITSELIRVPIEGGEPEAISNLPRVRYPHAHPDGTRITVSAGKPRLELWVMENFLPPNAVPQSPPDVAKLAPPERVTTPVAVTAQPPGPESATLPVSGETVTIQKIPLRVNTHWFLSISQDGKHLAYQPDGTDDIAVCELPDGVTRTIAKGSPERSVDAGAIISPDGKWIAYDLGTSAIYVSKIDGSARRKLYEPPSKGSSVAVLQWSPDNAEVFIDSKSKSGPKQFFALNLMTGASRDSAWVESKLSAPRAGNSWAFSGSGLFCARRVGDYPRMITIWDSRTGREEVVVERDAERVVGWTMGDERLLYSKNRGNSIDLWAVDVKDGKPVGESELLWKNLGHVTPLGVTRDGSIYFSVWKNKPEPSELWVMRGFLAKRGATTEAWRIQMEIPPDELLGPVNSLFDRKLGLQATFPMGWKISSAMRQASGGNVIAFSVAEAVKAFPRIIYWSATPWENPSNPANDFARAGPKPTTIEETYSWMRRRVELGAEGRIRDGYLKYTHNVTGYVSRTVNERPALSWSSEFERGELKWSEFMTLIYGENVIANVSIQVPAQSFEAVRAAFDQLVESVRVP